MALPSIDSIPALSTQDRDSVLDALFEPSEELHRLSSHIFSDRSIASYDDLVASVGARLTRLAASPAPTDTATLDSILGAHPRLGAKKVDSAQSRAEQAQLNTGAADEAEMLQAMNERYEAAFPPLRYVVFVNGRSRTEILADMKARIDHSDINAERAAAIKAMCDIAADRARKLQS